MIKFRTVSLIILMLGFVLSASSYARVPSRYPSHSGFKNSWHKPVMRHKPHHRMKAHYKKHKTPSKHSFLRKK